ncbi:YdcF family protein [Nakamurella sp. A5-74]|uniref:YdcF family protein n=1 Tax=Nakamurella sp. A5-74 TaxID=3158264 RepID=A0AAU8DQ71_9ACTN
MVIATGVLLLGLTCTVWGLVGVRRDPRRLRPSVAILAGALVTVIGLAAVVSASGLLPRTLTVALVVIGGVVAVAYPVLTVLLVLNGVTMIRRERPTPAHLLSLTLGLGMTALPVLSLIAIHLRDTRSPAVAVLGWLVLVVGSVLGYLAFAFGAFLLGTFLYRRIGRRLPARYIVVLGAGLRGRQVSPLLARRLDRAAAEFRRQGGAGTIVPSGGRGDDEERTEASAMADYLRSEHGVPAAQIVPEDRARTTRENLTFSRALFTAPDARAIVVTSGYHVLRAAVLTRELRMRARVVGCRTVGYYLPSAYLREFAAVLWANRVMNVILASAFTALTVSVITLWR